MSSPPQYRCRAKRHMPEKVFVTYDTMLGLAKSDTKEFKDPTSLECYAELATICDYSNQSETRVRESIKWLIANDWLVPLKQFGSHGSNRYRVVEHDDHDQDCPPFRYRDGIKRTMPFNLLWQQIKRIGAFTDSGVRPDVRFGWDSEGQGFIEVKPRESRGLEEDVNPGELPGLNKSQPSGNPKTSTLGNPEPRTESQPSGSPKINPRETRTLFCIDSVSESNLVQNHSVPTNQSGTSTPAASDKKSVGRLDGWLSSFHIPCDSQGKYKDQWDGGDCNFVDCIGKPTDEQRAKLEDFLDRLESGFFTNKGRKPKEEFKDRLTRFAQRPRGLAGLSFPWSKFIEEQTDNE
jgi:hypothetical protein